MYLILHISINIKKYIIPSFLTQLNKLKNINETNMAITLIEKDLPEPLPPVTTKYLLSSDDMGRYFLCILIDKLN